MDVSRNNYSEKKETEKKVQILWFHDFIFIKFSKMPTNQ